MHQNLYAAHLNVFVTPTALSMKKPCPTLQVKTVWPNDVISLSHQWLVQSYSMPNSLHGSGHSLSRLPSISKTTSHIPFYRQIKLLLSSGINYKPNLLHLRLFGSPCTSHILSTSLSKFDLRGEAAHFLGYAKDAKGYIL